MKLQRKSVDCSTACMDVILYHPIILMAVAWSQEVFSSEGCTQALCIHPSRQQAEQPFEESNLNPLFSWLLVAHYFKGSVPLLDMQS